MALRTGVLTGFGLLTTLALMLAACDTKTKQRLAVDVSVLKCRMEGEYGECEEDHHREQTAQEVGGIEPFVAENIVNRELTKGHCRSLPTRKAYR